MPDGICAWRPRQPLWACIQADSSLTQECGCALAICDAVRDLGLEVRLGLHTGECEVLDAKVAGIAVAIGARVSA
jgi:class 3 adenylate cyclase